MTTRNRVAHTATFLQTFHSGQTTAARRATVGAEGSEPKPAQAETAAVAFVTGRPAPRNDGSYMTEINGYPVKLGPAYVSEKQAKWMIDIATTRVLPEGATAKSLLVRLEQGFSRLGGTHFITNYKDLPRKAVEVPAGPAAPSKAEEAFKANSMPEVAAGRYAIVIDGVTKFYRITKGKNAWAGRTFIEAQASDDHYPVRSFAARNEVLRAISVNPAEAATRYGVELGSCHRCGRTLTDETSRALGIGPECRKK